MRYHETLLNKDKEEVLAYLNMNKIQFRIIKEDNNSFMITHDFKMDRLNLEIINNQVTNIKYG